MKVMAQKNGEPISILLVEDNPAHAELVMRSFEDNEVANKIYHVNDGEKAINYLLRRKEYSDENTSPRPQVILLDLRIPKIDGLEVLSTIKSSEEVSDIPVVILTTSAAELDVAKAYKFHANSYMVKPADFETFSEMMKELGYYWLAWNHQNALK